MLPSKIVSAPLGYSNYSQTSPWTDCSRSVSAVLPYSVPSILRSNRFRRDAKAVEEEEEMWFTEDDEEEGKAAAAPGEKPKPEDDFPDSYEKFMETKKGIASLHFWIVHPIIILTEIIHFLVKIWSLFIKSMKDVIFMLNHNFYILHFF